MKHAWYKNAMFYALDVETFFDHDNDGVGDFKGLIEKLDYLVGLGVTSLWLLPFYTSPNRDNGYDVSDYFRIDERLGTMKDFHEFMALAKARNLRIILDLVVNHTSIHHPWFQEARQNPHSRYHNYYVWSAKPLPYQREHLMFTGEENDVWAFDDVAGKYYLHRFYREQPDLNIGNRDVQEEILKIMKFWLSKGISGFRLDAAEILVEPYGMDGMRKEDLNAFLSALRDELTQQNPEAILIAEANIPPGDMKSFLIHNGRLQMTFNFFLNQHIFLALSENNAIPLKQALKKLPQRAREQQWLNFLRHHDELSLVLLNHHSQRVVMEKFASENNMRIYRRGIRRRLAPMMKNNLKVLKLCYSLLFSMPGTPLIRYGDEIGMGEDLSLRGRESVRTPMQWSADKNGGFSTAEKEKLIHPVIDDGEFSFTRVNVALSQTNEHSLYHWIKKIIALRKRLTEVGTKKVEVFHLEHQQVLVHGYRSRSGKTIFIHNLSGDAITLNTASWFGDQFSVTDLLNVDNVLPSDLRLNAYDFHWIKVVYKTSTVWP